MDIPAVIKSAHIAGAPIAFKWSDDIASSIDDTENPRLYKAVDAATPAPRWRSGLPSRSGQSGALTGFSTRPTAC